MIHPPSISIGTIKGVLYRLIAIMLGRLKMDVQECIDVYVGMFSEIFGKPLHWIPATIRGQLQSMYDSKILRRCILKIVATRAFSDEDKTKIAELQNSPNSQKEAEVAAEAVAERVLLCDGQKRGCHT
jgi:hypothetical protein